MRLHTLRFVGLFCFAVLLTVPGVGFAGRKPVAAFKPVDQFGDPLPKGAIVRLGSIRFKHATLDVRAVAFSPDGRLVASGGGDCTVRIWEANTGKPVAVLRDHGFNIIKRTTAGIDKKGRFFHRHFDGKLMRPKHGRVSGLDFSPNGKLLASSDTSKLIIWDVRSWRKLVEIDQKFLGSDNSSLKFTVDNNAIILSDGESYLYRFRAKDGKIEAKTYCARLRGIALHPDGKRVLAAVDDKVKLKIFSISRLALVGSHGNEPSDGGYCVAAFPNGNHVLVGGRMHKTEFEIWNPTTGSCRKVLPWTVDNSSDSRAVAVSPDGRWIAGVWGHGGVLIIDAKTCKAVRLIENTRFIRDLAFAPNGQLLATAGLRVRLWRTGSWKEVVSDELATPVLQARFINDGRMVNVGGAIYDLKGKLLKSVDRERLNLSIGSAVPGISPSWIPTRLFTNANGRLLIRNWSPWEHSVTIRDFKTGVELLRHETRRRFDPALNWRRFRRQYGVTSKLPIAGIKFTKLSQDGRRLLVGYHQSNPGYAVYDVSDGSLVRRVSIPEKNGVGVRIDDAVISADGSLVAAVSRQAPGVFVWNVGYNRKTPAGTLLHRLKWDAPVSSSSRFLAFSPNSRYVTAWLSTFGKEKQPPLHVWDARTGKLLLKLTGSTSCSKFTPPRFSGDGKLLATFHGPVAKVHSLLSGKTVAEFRMRRLQWLLFSKDSRFLAIGGDRLLVWDVKTGTFVMERTIRYPLVFVPRTFSPNSQYLASSSRPGEVDVWNVATKKKIFSCRPYRRGDPRVIFTPNGTRIISVYDNQTALVWSLPGNN